MKKNITVFIVLLLSLISFNNFQSEIMAQEKENNITFKNARFTIITQSLIRIEFSQNNKFNDNKTLFAENRSILFKDFSAERKENELLIKTSFFKLKYTPDGNSFSEKNLQVFIKKGNDEVIWYPGLMNKNNLGGTIRTLDGVRGKVPVDDGIISRDGWYLMDDSGTPVLTNDWVKSRDNKNIDWYLFAYGFDFKEALRSLTKISGKIPLPRKYALGSWYSRYWPYTSDEFKDIVNEYKKYDFPLDVMVLDMDWHKDGWTGWSWNRKLLPDAEELLKWFHEKDIKVTLNLHPAEGVKPHEDMYQDFMKDMNVDLTKYKPKDYPSLPYDAGNKLYLDNLFNHTHLIHEKEGIDFWWLDWQQFQYTKSIPDLRNLPWLNRYYFNWTSQNNKRGMSFSRWGGFGDQKYPIHFSGDAVSIWPMLEFEVPFTANSSNIGCFFWSHDIGGHMGGLDQECNARWVQFGAFTAALRLHSTRDKLMDKRPWLYEDKYLKSNQIVFHLRSTLFPYIYTSARYSSENSIPFIKPIYYEFPEKEIAYAQDQQYFFGESFIIAPIVSPGIGNKKVSSQKVWMPKGTWYNWFTNEKIIGNEQILNSYCDINSLPVFVKAATPIPMQTYTQRMASTPLKKLILRIYPGENDSEGKSFLYEDDGISQSYLKGNYSITNFTYKRKEYHHFVTIEPTTGKWQGQPLSREYIIEVPGVKAILLALLNGKEILKINENGMNKILIPEKSIYEKLNIEFVSEDMDNSSIRKEEYNKLLNGIFEGKEKNENLSNLFLSIDNIFKAENEKMLAKSFVSGISVYKNEDKISIVKDLNSSAAEKISIQVYDQFGLETKNIFQKEINLSNGDFYNFGITESITERFGMEVNRIVKVKFLIDNQECILEKILETKESLIYKWNLIGPFYYDVNKSIENVIYPIEKEINLTKNYIGKSNKNIKWIKHERDMIDYIDLKSHFESDSCIAYALTYLKSTTDQDIQFSINSDDGVEVWLNDVKILSHNIFRPIAHDPEIIKSKLRSGNNKLLVKISQGNGGWCFKIKTKTEKPIECNYEN